MNNHFKLEFVDSGLYFVQDENSSINLLLQAGMRIRIQSNPVIFGPPDPDPVLFSTDPDPNNISASSKTDSQQKLTIGYLLPRYEMFYYFILNISSNNYF